MDIGASFRFIFAFPALACLRYAFGVFLSHPSHRCFYFAHYQSPLHQGFFLDLLNHLYIIISQSRHTVNTVLQFSPAILFSIDFGSFPHPFLLSIVQVAHPVKLPQLLSLRLVSSPVYTYDYRRWQLLLVLFYLKYICQTKCKSEVAFTVTNAAVAFTPANLRQSFSNCNGPTGSYLPAR